MRRPTFFEPSSPGSAGFFMWGAQGELCWSTRSLDPAKEIGALSIKDVSFSVPVDTSLDTSRFSRRSVTEHANPRSRRSGLHRIQARALAGEHGYRVDVIDALWFGNHLPPEVNVVRRDLFECRPSDFEGCDQVIFLAGVSNDPMADYDPAQNFIQNAALPAYLAFTTKKAGVSRFIYASSCSIYGYTQDRLYDEDDPVTCSYPYGISKLQGERACFSWPRPDSPSSRFAREPFVAGARACGSISSST